MAFIDPRTVGLLYITLEALQDIILALDYVKVVAALNRLDKLEVSSDWGEGQDVPLQMTWGAGSAKIYRKRNGE